MSRAGKAPVAPIIIVKKVIEAPHGGHHGGAWKVAYADFVTAMMAFFLLMWLLGATDEQKRKGLADYFSPTLVAQKADSAGGHKPFGGESVIARDRYPEKAAQTGDRALTIPRSAGGDPRAEDRARFKKAAERIKQALARRAETRALLKTVRFVETREGLRIDLVDQADFAMFALGTDRLTPAARPLITAVAEVAAGTPNPLHIRGHTDSLPYAAGRGASNWGLSAARAEATRVALTRAGVSPARVARIEGVADREPTNPADPRDPANRRLSITLAWANGAN